MDALSKPHDKHTHHRLPHFANIGVSYPTPGAVFSHDIVPSVPFSHIS